jgi:hypothetical protein
MCRGKNRRKNGMDTARPALDRQIHDVVNELAGEFEPQVGREALERVVRESFEGLSEARIKSFIPILARRQARQRLRARRNIA